MSIYKIMEITSAAKDAEAADVLLIFIKYTIADGIATNKPFTAEIIDSFISNNFSPTV